MSARDGVRRVCVPQLLWEEIEAADLRGLERDYVMRIIDSCLRNNEQSYPLNKELCDEAIGSTGRRKLKQYLGRSKFIRVANNGFYTPNVVCKHYEVVADREGESIVSTLTTERSSGGKWKGPVVYRDIDFEELDTAIENAQLALGHQGADLVAISGLEHADLVDLIDAEIVRCATEAYVERYPRAKETEVHRSIETSRQAYRRYVEARSERILVKNGRLYSSVTSMPRWMRNRIVKFNGSSATVDISSAYPWFVAAGDRLTKKRKNQSTHDLDRMIGLIQDGLLYETLASKAGLQYATDADKRAVKSQTQMFCLFGELEFHPIWYALKEISPSVCRTILMWRRGNRGATRLANYLQRCEGSLMTRGVMQHLNDLNIRAVQVHDAVMVAPEHAGVAERYLVQHAVEKWDVKCRVKVTYA